MSEKELMMVCNIYENKLRELMTQEDFDEFTKETARKLFRAEMEGMKDGPFKDFVMEHFDEITE